MELKKLECLLESHKELAKEAGINEELAKRIVESIEKMELKNITKN